VRIFGGCFETNDALAPGAVPVFVRAAVFGFAAFAVFGFAVFAFAVFAFTAFDRAFAMARR
jgi:hypothetical protein